MGWKIRNRVPSDSALKDYDDRMSAREHEIRRPGRKINVISNEDYARTMKAKAAERSIEEEVKMLWQSKHLDVVRQRNNLIRYKLFLLFKDNFNIDTSNADTVSKQPLARAIAAVCNSITKDAVTYTHLTSLSKDGGSFPWNSDLLLEYVWDSLGIPIDRDDILSVRTAAKEKKTLLELISSQVKRDLEEVTARLKLQQKLPSIPGYSDPEVAKRLELAGFVCIKDVDNSMLENDGTQREKDDIEKQYVAAVHKELDESLTGRRSYWNVDAGQRDSLKSLLNTKASIRAFYDLTGDNEWSNSVEGLSEEKKVLESLVGPNSDAILRTIDETIAATYLENNKLVEESAKIRNHVWGSRSDRHDDLDSLEETSAATSTDRFEKSRKEESVKFQDMENDTAYKKLFPSSEPSREHNYENVYMFTMSGFMSSVCCLVNFKCSTGITILDEAGEHICHRNYQYSPENIFKWTLTCLILCCLALVLVLQLVQDIRNIVWATEASRSFIHRNLVMLRSLGVSIYT